MALEFADRIRPGGEMIFYAGSFAYDQAQATLEALIERRLFDDAGRFKTLHMIKKRRT
jgi:hypothetical protein